VLGGGNEGVVGGIKKRIHQKLVLGLLKRKPVKTILFQVGTKTQRKTGRGEKKKGG